ncbi:NUDIX hydrolase [Rossellomorea vietnamensis]|uniref:NUDIX hydrolase n=1 Tax=Rossellomorea vietnamensis TaxID=218284 RepID=A0A5D4NTL3_9BACI|nr:NUDIX hydrolase [Rossellomorea vietnamensis]TYS16991.1 NUDIX hydrolase [Rossellomorea vietnamensis]
MELLKKTHRAFGVYGICTEDDKLLVINKSRGPYIHRFDLPGGSLEESEGLTEAMKREFTEETGLTAEIKEQIGVQDFIFPCEWKDFTHIHHIAVFYLVERTGGELAEPEQFDGQDSAGAEWISMEEATADNSSPLVLKAMEWLRNRGLDLETQRFENWVIRETKSE